MPTTRIKVKAEIILLTISDTPLSKDEKDTLMILIEQSLNDKASICVVGETRIGMRFHFLKEL